MKFKNAMQLKAKVNNLAIKFGIFPQYALQNYYIEHFLTRLSISPYRENFIIKGGVLLMSLLGLANRTTMDIDTTLRGIPMDKSRLKKVLDDVCNMDIDDECVFKVVNITDIAEHNDYPGLRVELLVVQETMRAQILIDITTGDSITPDAEEKELSLMFEEGTIPLLAYSIETLLAEKIETILSRGILNSRPRDFYDIYLLWKMKSVQIRMDIMRRALQQTCEKRKTESLINQSDTILSEIELNSTMQVRWKDYRKTFSYAKEISFKETIDSVREILRNIREA